MCVWQVGIIKGRQNPCGYRVWVCRVGVQVVFLNLHRTRTLGTGLHGFFLTTSPLSSLDRMLPNVVINEAPGAAWVVGRVESWTQT